MSSVIRLVGFLLALFGFFGILGTIPNLLGSNSIDLINPFAMFGFTQPTFDIPLIDLIVWTVLMIGGGYMLIHRGQKRK